MKHWDLFLKFDAVGLGIFTVIGSTFAYNAFGLNFLAMSFSGVLTAIGGGILRMYPLTKYQWYLLRNSTLQQVSQA